MVVASVFFLDTSTKMSYKPLNNKELLQHQLSIIHSHTDNEEYHYLADIRANIAVKWESTVKQIESLRLQAEKCVLPHR